MKIPCIAVTTTLATLSAATADEFPRIALIDGSTPTKALIDKPGSYFGETFIFEDEHSGDVPVRIGVW